MNSHKELEAFAENAVAVNRLILGHLSMSEAHAPPKPYRPSDSSDLTEDIFHLKLDGPSSEESSPPGMFTIGLEEDGSVPSSYEDNNSYMWRGQSPVRQLSQRTDMRLTSNSRPLPRKVPSAMF